MIVVNLALSSTVNLLFALETKYHTNLVELKNPYLQPSIDMNIPKSFNWKEKGKNRERITWL